MSYTSDPEYLYGVEPPDSFHTPVYRDFSQWVWSFLPEPLHSMLASATEFVLGLTGFWIVILSPLWVPVAFSASRKKLQAFHRAWRRPALPSKKVMSPETFAWLNRGWKLAGNNPDGRAILTDGEKTILIRQDQLETYTSGWDKVRNLPQGKLVAIPREAFDPVEVS